MEWSDLRGTLDGVNLDAIRPKGDFVLVREIQPEGIQVASHVSLTKGKMLKLNNREKGLRRGVVVAVGKGDRLFSVFCPSCARSGGLGQYGPRFRAETASRFKCRFCGGRLEFEHDYFDNHRDTRCEMHVKPGDEVVYPQTPANDFQINGEKYSFLHEEQQVLAVIEREAE